ncbi:CoA binding protein [Streptococcus dysgalactiae subsp. dysgalactiae]|uniref:CoA binding protein n=1 Tax=Streptococcus dysgalactiae subsp. dysgalactiae TaxID=99822 RepID=A0A380JR89_STRDY|nr:CoA-binding protein [Streptococcus dysgalactiae]EFY03682.1 putative CoA binding protein [Streptococcus dysgalactiae subsp. dysgalactiae ATCC 27957]MCB2832906.1 CoA-binding protein [Streptococcus dysgalactiae subsp. dysgalactiae]MCB2840507.1 CoA-binding protein [Streptococcus dysgalactiae subsp. dysgalactiae]MCB2844328.1 CoA-binding protein [Streptococcus dysgalactiae subsp. dysgalactiae]MCB2846064.1 CoA-binding protein [Streptococcus dysgalactiae subsp. dysgalactiae]
MTYRFQNPSDDILRTYLESAKTIAIVGLSDRQDTAAYQVAKFMQAMDYQIVPVNSKLAGQTILGELVYATIKAIPFEVDIVDVFRRSEFLPEVARDFLESQAKVFWAQLGLENQEAEMILRSAGKQAIVMNRCLKVDYLDLIIKQG